MTTKIAPRDRSRSLGALFGTSVEDTYYTVLKGCAMLRERLSSLSLRPEIRGLGASLRHLQTKDGRLFMKGSGRLSESILAQFLGVEPLFRDFESTGLGELPSPSSSFSTETTYAWFRCTQASARGLQKSTRFPCSTIWLERKESNLRMAESKSAVLTA